MDASFALAQDHRQFQSPLPVQQAGYPHQPQPSHQTHHQHQHQQFSHHSTMSSSVGVESEAFSQLNNARRPSRSSLMPSLGSPPPTMALPPPPTQAFSSHSSIQSQPQLPRSASQASLGTSTGKPSRGPSPSAAHPRHPYSVSSASQSYTDTEVDDLSDRDYYYPPPMQQRTSRHTSLQQQPNLQLYQQQQSRQQQLNINQSNSLYRQGSASSVNSIGDYYNPPVSHSLNSPTNGYSPTAGYSPDAAYARDSYSTALNPSLQSQPRRDGHASLIHGVAKTGSNGVVSPGSYFAAYPPSSGSSPSTGPSYATRDRASSNASDNMLEYLSPEPRSMGNGATNGKHGNAGLENSPGSSNMLDTDFSAAQSGPSTSSYLEPRPHQAQASHSTSLHPPQPQAGSQPSSRSPGSRHRNKDRNRTGPSSRRALTAALELAKSAVQLDTTSDDPHGAVLAYAKSVQLLGEVMERVMRGESTTSSHHTEHSSSGSATGTREPSDGEERKKSGRRRSVVAKEEEVRKLKAIHDTYADRMRILCLIYSIEIPQTKPSSHATTPPRTPQREAAFDAENEGDRHGTVPDAPEDVSVSSDAETDTIKRAHSIQRVAEGDARERRDSSGPIGDEQASTNQEQELEAGPFEGQENNTPTSLIVPPLSNNEPHTPSSSSTVTPRASYTSPPPQRSNTNLSLNTSVNGTVQTRVGSLQDVTSPSANGALPPISVMSPTSYGRASMLPPPRPPPTAPLPTRPRMPSGTIIPTQILNQPLPPLPPSASPPSKEKNLDASQQTLTRHSSASSVSAVSSISAASGTSTTASGSSSASVPSSVTSLAPSGLGALPSNTGIVGRPRGNSNAHARNTSIAERLGAVNEEREEDEAATKIPKDTAGNTSPIDVVPSRKNPTPPPEVKYRSRSSSMVSLKDRERAKSQVLGSNNPLPLPPLPTSTNASSQIPPSSTASRNDSSSFLFPAPSPNKATFDSWQTSRERGSSVGSSATQMSEDYVMDISRSRASSVIPYTAGGVPPPESAPIVFGALGSSDPGAIKISASPSSGTISQRRNKNSLTNSQAPAPFPDGPSIGLNKLTSAVLPASTATSLGLTGRSRASSNPGKWPVNMVNMGLGDPSSRPPMPPPPMSAGIRRQFPGINISRYQSFSLSSQSSNINASTASLSTIATAGAPIAGTPASALPPPPPSIAVLRPYHLMSLLRKSMTDRTGGYITSRLHVPHEVWTQGSAKLTNIAEKTKVVAVLVAALEELSNASVEFCGATTGIAASTSNGKGGRKEGETWAKKLEEFERAFGQVGDTFGKKLGVGGGFVVKKSVGMASWSTKLFDKIATAGKGYDSPAAYATLLASFFGKVQLLEEHTQALYSSSQPPCYSTLPKDLSTRIQGTTKNVSELFARVVLTFVFRDLSLMLDKYHKTCDRWIQSNPGTQN